MKITTKRPKSLIGNLVFGQVFFCDEAYWLITSQPCKNNELLCINIVTGEGRFFETFESVEIVNGEFVIQG